MHAASLFRTEGEASDPEVKSKLDGEPPAVDAEYTTYLDGNTCYFGTAADLLEVQQESVTITEDEVATQQVKGLQEKAVDFYADVATDPGFIGVSSASDGEWLVQRIAAQTGVEVLKTWIDVDAFADHIRQQAETADAWNVSRSRDYGGGKEETSIDYHDAANIDDAQKGTLGLGFQYFWGDTRVRGIVYESGYVAMYRDMVTIEFAKWLREEVLPFLRVDRGEQRNRQHTLTEDEHDRAEVAATDGGEK